MSQISFAIGVALALCAPHPMYPPWVPRLYKFTITLAVACAVATTLVVALLKPSTIAAYAIWALWLNSANIAIACILIARRRTSRQHSLPILPLAAASASGGLFIAEVAFIHPDPQGAVALLFTPIAQAAVAAVALALTRIYGRSL